MKAKGVLARFWGEAVSTAVYLLNRSPMKSVTGKTPYEACHEHKPNVSYLHVFGCVAHVKVTKPHLAKLDDRSTLMVLLGYEPGSAEYYIYDPQATECMSHMMLCLMKVHSGTRRRQEARLMVPPSMLSLATPSGALLIKCIQA